jgi:hypothetical protein
MTKHRSAVGENAMIAASKYFFTKNKKRKGRHLLRKVLSTKTGWRCAYFIQKRSEMLRMVNNGQQWSTMMTTLDG